MLSLPRSVRVYFSTVPTDMRRSFDGLAALTREVLKHDPLTGHLFVFLSRHRDRVKVLYWDGSGLCLWYKRLEKGLFHFPAGDDATVEIHAWDLPLLLEGIDPTTVKRRPRYVPPGSSAAE